MESARFCPVPWHGAGQGAWQRFVDADVGGGQQIEQGGVNRHSHIFSRYLFGFFVLARHDRTGSAEREMTGATPPFLPLARHGEAGSRSRLYLSLREGSPTPRAGRTTTTRTRRTNPAGRGPVIAGNREELSPGHRAERFPFGFNCGRAAAGRARHPKGLAAARRSLAAASQF